jgi:hypothetical protein
LVQLGIEGDGDLRRGKFVFDWLRKAKLPAGLHRTGIPPIDPTLFDQGGERLFKALAQFWASSDPKSYSPGCAEVQIKALEDRYSIRLPDEFRSYLLNAAPRITYIDDIGTQWWAADEIKSIPDECPDGPPGKVNDEIEREKHAYLIFSDYLIWCYAWAICCSDGPNRGKIALIGGLPDVIVADSFRQFLLLELTDDLSIHQGARGASRTRN